MPEPRRPESPDIRLRNPEGDDWRGRREAIDAYLKVRPEDGPDEAERPVTRAIVSAATHHTAWFWRSMRYRRTRARLADLETSAAFVAASRIDLLGS